MRRHELDLASLIAGLVFAAIAAAYLVGAFTDVHIGSGWVLPLALIGLGAAGLAGSLRRTRRTLPAASEPTEATPETAPEAESE